MSVLEDGLPYSKKRLEDLASALRIDSAYLWINPSTNAFGLKELPQRAGQRASSSFFTSDETEENE